MRDFYQHQDKAHARSRRNAFWLVFAILGTAIVTSSCLVYLFLISCAGIEVPDGDGVVDLSAKLRTEPRVIAFLSLGAFLMTTTAITVKSWWKIRQLRAGGGALIAEDLGGTPVENHGQLDLPSRQLLNVVEELAVAAAIPPPTVYCMWHESSINAFAAGYTPRDAVIGVSAGCLKHLNREQLQGVIAHEFSHILNGDMRQNIHILGVLHGVLFITEAAESCWRAAGNLWNSNDTSGGSVKFSIMLALAAAFLWPVGMVGLFFATVAKAAISRQREFLADATAVELSRNPHGIASALKRIAGFERGTRIENPRSVEASHLFFANGRTVSRLLSTHPPIAERILRLDPLWDGVPEFEEETAVELTGVYQSALHFASPLTDASGEGQDDAIAGDDHHDLFVVDDRGEKFRDEIMSSLPIDLIELARDPDAAEPMVIALLAVQLPPDRLLDRVTSVETAQLAAALTDLLTNLDRGQLLLLLDESLATLARTAAKITLQRLDELSQDPATDLYGFCWRHSVQSLIRAVRKDPQPKPRFQRLAAAEASCSVVMSALVQAGGNFGLAGEYAFQRGIRHLDLPNARYVAAEDCDIAALEDAVNLLQQASARAKNRLCQAISDCITADHAVTEEESLLVRGLVAGLGRAIPQLLPGHPVVPGA